MSTKIPHIENPAWHRLEEQCHALPWFQSLSLIQQQEIKKVFICSDFIAKQCINHPELLHDLMINQWRLTAHTKEEFKSLLKPLLIQRDEKTWFANIRKLRQWQFVRIAWRDLTGRASLHETVTELSAFADAMLEHAQRWIHQQLKKIYGNPINNKGQKQQLCIIAVGKLGANELNFSSDIDLIFAFRDEGETTGKKIISSQEFFFLLAQKLIKALNQMTENGFVFRVDMRLRPFGLNGPLVISFSGLKNYYQTSGRDWERYAMTRSRLITGTKKSKAKLSAIIDTFVYRPYLDFSVIDSLRKMKQLIKRETHGLEKDIKRGDGGIREIEFIVQSFQLIRAGKEKILKNTSILALLPTLAELNLLSQSKMMQLMSAYEFFRHLEHRLQEFQDTQTQLLPNDEISWHRLALAMQFNSLEVLQEKLEKHRKVVSGIFQNLIELPKHNLIPVLKDEFINEELNSTEIVFQIHPWLSEDAKKLLDAFSNSDMFLKLISESQQRYFLLVIHMLRVVEAIKDKERVAELLIELLTSLVNQINYIDLLMENPFIWQTLISLYQESKMLAQQIQAQPYLLEELLNKQLLYSPYSVSKLDDELRQYLLAMPQDDLPLQMEYLRRFKETQILRVAAADLKGTLSIMKVSDHLTFTASSILNYVLRMAWHHLIMLHGRPQLDETPLNSSDFCILGYGKLGGIELNYNSDLDLVFLHPDIDLMQMTDGEKAITNGEFYIRLCQKIIFILNDSSMTIRLYEVDTRLRPSGNSGLLANSLSAFSEYQQQKAWTWEHQALIRARAITGNEKMQLAFYLIRQDQLCKPRDEKLLVQDVTNMREKMRSAAKKTDKDLFNLADDLGGIKDIEFLVQFLVLRFAYTHPRLIEYSDNIRILESLMIEGILSIDCSEKLADCYRYFRSLAHRASLQNQPPIVAHEQVKELTKFVIEQWKLWGLLCG